MIYNICYKSSLMKNMMRAQKQFPQEYGFVLPTWTLPAELEKMRESEGQPKDYQTKENAIKTALKKHF